MALNQGYSSGGSSNSAQSFSFTNGTAATQAAQANAAQANTTAMENWREAAAWNAAEAQKQRDWQEKMAATTIQRTIDDMKNAGINPILAASAGFSADAISSGATASMGNPNSFMSNTFADTQSASTASGSSWQNSENGLATALTALGTAISEGLNSLTSGTKAEGALKVLESIGIDTNTGRASNGGKQNNSNGLVTALKQAMPHIGGKTSKPGRLTRAQNEKE